MWSDLMELKIVPVLEDAEFSGVLQREESSSKPTRINQALAA
jgi:hypothetical protein